MTTGSVTDADIVDGFGSSIDALGSFEDAVDHGRIDRSVLATVAASLASTDWLGVASGDSPLDRPFAALVDFAERAGSRVVPLPFPLLETWTAIRLLECVGPVAKERLERIIGGGLLVSVDVDALCGVVPPGSTRTGVVPHAENVDEVLVVTPGADAAAVRVVGPHGWSPTAGIDPTAPSGSCSRDTADTAPVLGSIATDDAARLATEYLLLQTADIVGAAGRLHSGLLDHLATREQFGRPLNAFQALQHRSADMLVALETSRSLLRYATWVLEAGDPTSVELSYLAKGYAAEECWRLGNEVIQLHGGLGYTWEARVHHGVRRIAYRALTGRSARSCYATAGRMALDRGELLALA